MTGADASLTTGCGLGSNSVQIQTGGFSLLSCWLVSYRALFERQVFFGLSDFPSSVFGSRLFGILRSGVQGLKLWAFGVSAFG